MIRHQNGDGGTARLYPAMEGLFLSKGRRRRRRASWIAQALHCGTTLALILAWPLTTRADDYDRYDLSLRFPAVFSRFSPYASIAAGGNAQAASAWSSSTNPASAAWPHPELPYFNSVSPQFSALGFEEGTQVYVAGEAAVLNAGTWGVFVPAAAQVWSNHEQTGAGTGFEFEAEYFQVPWGKLLDEDWAVGANFNYMSTDIRFDASDTRLARTRTDDYGLRLGVLHRPLDVLRVGLTLDYGYVPGWTERFDPLEPGTAAVRTKDITQRVLVRPGLAWQYAPHGTFYADYQAGVFWNDTGTLWVHRFPLGLEYWLVPRGLVARMGTTVDTRGGAALTAGAGMAVGKRALVSFAYQYGMFPELRPEFGPAQTFALSAAIAF